MLSATKLYWPKSKNCDDPGTLTVAPTFLLPRRAVSNVVTELIFLLFLYYNKIKSNTLLELCICLFEAIKQQENSLKQSISVFFEDSFDFRPCRWFPLPGKEKLV